MDKSHINHTLSKVSRKLAMEISCRARYNCPLPSIESMSLSLMSSLYLWTWRMVNVPELKFLFYTLVFFRFYFCQVPTLKLVLTLNKILQTFEGH